MRSIHLLPFAFLVACGTDSDSEDTTVDLAGTLQLDVASLSLVLNGEGVLLATFTPDGGDSLDISTEATWTSQDEQVATVEDGAVVATGAGSVTVDVTYDGLTVSAEIDVTTLSVSGTVMLLNWPLADVELEVTDPDGETWIAASSALEDGSFLVEGLGLGDYTVTPKLGRNTFEPASAVFDPEAGDLSFNLVTSAYPDTADRVDTTGYLDAEPLILDGALLPRTLWPHGDTDWFSVDLVDGQVVELFSTNICATCDSEVYIYDTDGVTELTSEDDYIGYESRVLFTAPADGTYYVHMTSHADPGVGVLSYSVGALTWEDGDDDGYGAFHDCDDDNDNAYPWNTSNEWITGVDTNCDGAVTPDPTAPDAFEAGDSASNPRQMLVSEFYFDELMYRGTIATAMYATLTEDDVDWWAITIPPYGAYYLDYFPFFAVSSGPRSFEYIVYEADGVTVSELSSDFWNDSAEPLTYLIELTNSGVAGAYYPLVIDYGVDADGDGYSTQGDSDERDCDDSDDAVTTECYAD